MTTRACNAGLDSDLKGARYSVEHWTFESVRLSMQEYLKLNDILIKSIATGGANTAMLSDAAIAWLEAELQLNSWQSKDFPSLFGDHLGDANFQKVKSIFAKRRETALKPQHYLALLLDPRPRVRAFVAQHGLIGSADNKDLGNTPAIQEAFKHLDFIAKNVVIKQDNKVLPPAAATKVLQTQLLVFLNVRFNRMCLLWNVSVFAIASVHLHASVQPHASVQLQKLRLNVAHAGALFAAAIQARHHRSGHRERP